MPTFEESLARMKTLYTYGKDLNESKNVPLHTLEYHAVAANGKAYGIVKECNKYYIKTAPKDKELVAEAYDYIGGISRKKDYEYESYPLASRHFELKINSINESCESETNISTLDPFKKNTILAESTDKFANELARQRQIMYNVSMLMNESTEIGADRKDDVVKYDKAQPEAEKGAKGDKPEGSKDGKAVLDKDFKKKTNGVDKKVGPFDQDAPKSTDQLKENCEGGSCEKDWGSEGIGKGRDPKSIGWEIDGQKTVNEEEEDWASKGLPSTPGVGDADTDHNNDPFNKAVNEEEETDVEDTDVEDPDITVDDDTDIDTDIDTDSEGEENYYDDLDSDMDSESMSDTDLDAGVNDEDGSFEDGEDISDDDMTDDSTSDLQAKIDELQAQIDALRSQIDGENTLDDTDSDIDDVDVDVDDVPTDGTTDDIEDSGDDESGFNAEFNDVEGDEFDGDSMDNLDGEGEDSTYDDDIDECGDGSMSPIGLDSLNENAQKRVSNLVDSIVKDILAENELHDFGKHPGYRKKPMELPTTGEDKNQWGRDWNDESVHNETPFGEKIGSSAPFTELVDAVTKEVMSQLAGSAFSSDKKKEQ